MNYIVMDLEWNQPNPGRQANKAIPFEIIEIGAVKLNSERKKIGEFSRLIQPQVYRSMHRITEQLIHIHIEDLEKEEVFPVVGKEFLEWCGEDCLFCTWGPLDLVEFQRNLQFYDMTPLSQKPIAYYDVQKLFSIAYEDSKSRKSLEYAVDFLNIDKDIPFHRAFSDAYYTAKVLAGIQDEEVLENYSYDVFQVPKKKKDEIKVVFPTYAKYISREFENKSAAMADREVISTKCYLCRRNIRRKIKWFTPNGKHYYSVALCNKHGYMKAKIRMKKTEDEKVYVVKTTKFITPEEVTAITEKQEKAKELRRKKRHS